MKAVPRTAYTVLEVAESLGCSRQSVTALIASGQLKAFGFGKNGHAIRVHAASLDDYLANVADYRDIA